MVINNKPHIQS